MTATSLLAAFILAIYPNVSNCAEAVVKFDRQCAHKDIAAMILIEDHGNIGELPPDELAKAWQTLLDARTACSEGHVSDAIELYQTVLDLGPPRAFLNQMTARREGAGQSRK
jgi:hypothetical protein